LQTYNVTREKEEICSNIIKVAITEGDRGLHPTQKPLQLMELLVSLVTTEGETVLDPFMGSGTTCVAAQNLGRSYIGIDINESYAEIAKKRLMRNEIASAKQHREQLAFKIN